MKNSQITEYSILNGVGTVLYIAFVALIMRQVPILFGEMESTFLGPIAFLLLFFISATAKFTKLHSFRIVSQVDLRRLGPFVLCTNWVLLLHHSV